MAGTTPIYGIPYPESSDLVANYPALGESLAETLDDKLPTYAATAPTSPSVGQVWIDSSGSPIGKVWDGSAWIIFSGAGAANFSDAATGTYTDTGIDYKYITYTGSGTLTVTTAGLADVLLLAGGGGGETGGGGAGGHFYMTDTYLPAGTLTVTVGAGGARRNNGIASRLGNYFSPGGGSGSDADSANGLHGRNGGSGGGASSTGGAGITDLGNNGGNGISGGTGGGGGAGAVGTNATSPNYGAAGGAGLANSITGSSVTRAGGGGGGGISGGGAAGSGGGGAGATGTGSAGTVNTGGGGGGGWTAGAAGGSGIVIIRVKV